MPPLVARARACATCSAGGCRSARGAGRSGLADAASSRRPDSAAMRRLFQLVSRRTVMTSRSRTGWSSLARPDRGRSRVPRYRPPRSGARQRKRLARLQPDPAHTDVERLALRQRRSAPARRPTTLATLDAPRPDRAVVRPGSPGTGSPDPPGSGCVSAAAGDHDGRARAPPFGEDVTQSHLPRGTPITLRAGNIA